MPRAPTATALARCAAAAAAVAWPAAAVPPAAAQAGAVSVQVLNAGEAPVTVRVLDLVCGRELFAGEIVDEASVQVAACPGGEGLATIRVLGRPGDERTFEGLADPSEVQFDFSPS